MEEDYEFLSSLHNYNVIRMLRLFRVYLSYQKIYNNHFNIDTVSISYRREKPLPFIIKARMGPVFLPTVIYPTEIVRQLMALCLLIYILQYSVARKVGIISGCLFLCTLIELPRAGKPDELRRLF